MDETLNYIFKKMGRVEHNLMKMAKRLDKTSKFAIFTSTLSLALLACQHGELKRLRRRVTSLECAEEDRVNDWFNKTYNNSTEGDVFKG